MTREGGGGLEVLAGLHLAWVREVDLPPGVEWLTPAEREVLAGLKLPKRRTDWLLGRWAAKRAVGAMRRAGGGEPGLPEIEILAGEDGRPRFVPGPGRLSISHAGGLGFAAVGPGETPVGCDVEVVEPRSEAFVADYLTEREAEAVRSAGPEGAALASNLIWSAKESALKALGQGLRLDTRLVEVEVADWSAGGAWSPLRVTGPHGGVFAGSWRLKEGLVWTVLAGHPRGTNNGEITARC